MMIMMIKHGDECYFGWWRVGWKAVVAGRRPANEESSLKTIMRMPMWMIAIDFIWICFVVADLMVHRYMVHSWQWEFVFKFNGVLLIYYIHIMDTGYMDHTARRIKSRGPKGLQLEVGEWISRERTNLHWREGRVPTATSRLAYFQNSFIHFLQN